MPNSNQHVRERQRLDFAKIQGTIQIPNLIEVQMKSYQRFLQMDLLPSEREDGGLQSVFTSVFPIKDFREMSQLEFVDYSIGNWECKCGRLVGLDKLGRPCVIVLIMSIAAVERGSHSHAPTRPSLFSSWKPRHG